MRAVVLGAVLLALLSSCAREQTVLTSSSITSATATPDPTPERSEFDWVAKEKQYPVEPLEPGDYVVYFRFAQGCPDPEEPQTGPCAAFASTTVTLEPASTPSATPSPVP